MSASADRREERDDQRRIAEHRLSQDQVPPAHWAAPIASAPLDAVVTLPGSKSQTNRALVLAALADGGSRLGHPLRSRDTTLMATAMTALGASVSGETDWLVRGPAVATGDVAVDVGNAGTVARFLPAVAALGSAVVTVDGDPRVRERPLRPLLDALRLLGAEIDEGGRRALPLTVHGSGRVRGGEVTLDASSSSQLVSGLLLAAPRFDAGITVCHEGPPLPSAPHLAMTVAMLRRAGAQVDDDQPARWRIAPGGLRPVDTDIEPDLSTAAAFVAAAVITGGTVLIPGWPLETTQPGAVLPELLTRVGARCTLSHEDGLRVTGTGSVGGLDVDLRDCGELAPVLAALAAVADSPSRLRGIAHLRLQETDRLAALARELGALGTGVRETEDGLIIYPRPLHCPDQPFHTYADHRIAMAAALLGLVVPGLLVEDIATTAKTVPGFVQRWHDMLGTAVTAGASA